MSDVGSLGKPRLIFKPFTKPDFYEYLAWFQDGRLSLALGPMVENDEWLDAVLNPEPEDRNVSVYSPKISLNESGLVAVVCLVGKEQGQPIGRECIITSIAVDPKLRGSGIGRQVVLQLTVEYESVTAFVCADNPDAGGFFAACGFRETGMENGMRVFTGRN